MERALIVEYEALVDEVLAGLSAANHGEAVALLSLIDEVRGFGPVKLAAVEAYRTRLRAALQSYRGRKEAPPRTEPLAAAEAV